MFAPARNVDVRPNVNDHPPSPLAGEFSKGGEGDARGVMGACYADSSEADLRNDPARLHTCTPHPNPLPQGEREQRRHACPQMSPRESRKCLRMSPNVPPCRRFRAGAKRTHRRRRERAIETRVRSGNGSKMFQNAPECANKKKRVCKTNPRPFADPSAVDFHYCNASDSRMSDATTNTTLPPGTPAPRFKLPASTGQTVDLADYRGK